MAIKDILLHLDNSESSESRMRFAIALAQSHEAHLTGLYLIHTWDMPGYVEGQIPSEVLEQQTQRVKQEASRSQEHFNTAIEHAGLRAEWRSVEGEPLDNLVLQARYADLTVLGQPDPRILMDWPFAHRIPLESGRPAVVVPSIGVPDAEINRVLVAWSGSRESARAVNDALPLLERAQQVFVLTVDLPKDERGSPIPGADISLHLSRHGVNAEAESVTGADISVGDVVLSRAADKWALMDARVSVNWCWVAPRGICWST